MAKAIACKHETTHNILKIKRLAIDMLSILVETGFALRTRFPAPVNPEPLAGMLADDSLEDGVEPAGVFSGIARNLKWRMKLSTYFPSSSTILRNRG